MRFHVFMRYLLVTAVIGLPGLAGKTAGAQGILIPRPEIREQPFCVKSVKVTSTIDDATATTTVEQTFVNNSPVEQEGTYLFPLPDGASVTSFTLRAGDRVIEGRLLSKEEARREYESIVRRRKDPGLLEYEGRGLFRASVFPIPPRDERVLTLKYVEILKPEGGVKKFAYPLTTGRYSARPIQTESVTVKIKTNSPLRTVYSPTHDVSVRRVDDHVASASWEGHGEIPDRDFVLYYATSASDVGLSLLTYQTSDRDGYFMLVAAPRFTIPKERILPKQIVFVLDRTGSMSENHKLEQARGALKYCLDNLNPNDRFDVVTFNESPDTLSRTLMSATDANIAKAQRFIRDLDATGGTNIDEALRAALGLLRGTPGTQKMVVFLTDGLPTVGKTDTKTILADVRDINKGEHIASTDGGEDKEAAAINARVFSFGVGYDVNVPFLDQLAEDTRGDSDYVRPTENIESIVSAFYSKVTSPILANLRFASSGVETYDVYPKTLPDLFKGNQLVITGRYRGNGPGAIRLAGFAQGREQIYRMDNAFAEEAATSSLVPRIWAMRKIGYLLDEVRLHQNQEVVDEIVCLSKDYGIITPYTSYLADERQGADLKATPYGSGGLRYDNVNGPVTGTPMSNYYFAPNGVSGADATFRSLNAKGYQRGGQAPAGAQGGFGGYGGGGYAGPQGEQGPAGPLGKSLYSAGRAQLGDRYGDASDAAKAIRGRKDDNRESYKQVQEVAGVQNVAGRTFYRRQNIWFDNGYKDGAKVVKVKALSDAYFQVLHAVPALNRYAAVGDEVVINLGRNAVQFGADGKEKLTDTELKELTAK